MHDQETEEIIGTSYQRKHSEHNKNSSIAVSIWPTAAIYPWSFPTNFHRRIL